METWFWILGSVLLFLAIAGNGFTIFLVCSRGNLRTKTNAFIVSLAVADSGVSLGVIPSLLACDVTNTCYWSLQVFLSWNDVVRWLFSYLSVLNLCSLVLDRYIAIVKPFKYITFMTIVCYSSDNFLLDSVIYTGCFQDRTSALLRDPSDQYRCSCGLNSMEIFPCVLQVLCFASMLLHVWSASTLAKQLTYHPPSSTLLALIGASAFAFNKYPHKPYIF